MCNKKNEMLTQEQPNKTLCRVVLDHRAPPLLVHGSNSATVEKTEMLIARHEAYISSSDLNDFVLRTGITLPSGSTMQGFLQGITYDIGFAVS